MASMDHRNRVEPEDAESENLAERELVSWILEIIQFTF